MEQSLRLAGLGLSSRTADMCHVFVGNSQTSGDLWETRMGRHWLDPNPAIPVEARPCWSLDALWQLIPSPVNLGGNKCMKIMYAEGIVYRDECGGDEHWYMDMPIMDAAYNMVKWCLENGLIKPDEEQKEFFMAQNGMPLMADGLQWHTMDEKPEPWRCVLVMHNVSFCVCFADDLGNLTEVRTGTRIEEGKPFHYIKWTDLNTFCELNR